MLILLTIEHEKNKIKLDEDLLIRIGNDDVKAFEELYYKTDRAVMGFALSIVKNRYDAEDVMQDTYIQIKKYAKNYKKQGKPMAWILTIVKHLALAKITNKHSNHFDIDDQFDLADKENHYENLENSIILKALLKNLNDEERNIVVLHAQTGMKHREIAEILNLPLSTVLSKYTRAISKMKKSI